MPSRALPRAAGFFVLTSLAACGGAPVRPVTPAPATSTPVATAPALQYVPVTDPMFLQYEHETNVYYRRILAKMWVGSAGLDDPGDVQRARLGEATRALAEAERAALAPNDPCAAGIAAALSRADATKRRLERQYLQLSESGSLDNAESKLVDLQIHVLRDEVEALQPMSGACPPGLYPDADAQP